MVKNDTTEVFCYFDVQIEKEHQGSEINESEIGVRI